MTPKSPKKHQTADAEPSAQDVAGFAAIADAPPSFDTPETMATAAPVPTVDEYHTLRLAVSLHEEVGLPHALDVAPVNSKIVCTRDGALLATPDTLEMLPVGDPAHRLPEGARITRTGPESFLSVQLNATGIRSTATYKTALAAIGDFVAHFHPTGHDD